MADDYLTSSDQEPLGPVGPPKKGLAAYASTRRGRIVMGALALVAIVAVIGVALTVFVFPSPSEAADPLAPPAGALASGAVVVPVSDEQTATAQDAEPLSDTFAFRDIFVPTVNPDVAPDASDDATDTADDTNGDTNGSDTVPANTLLLEDTREVDGELVAVFTWNGQEYIVAEGEQLGDSPWQVVDINGDTVVLLYGDNRVSLTVGQGITK